MKPKYGLKNIELMAGEMTPAWQRILLRGGRLVKQAGQVVSLSPSFGQVMGAASISPIALGAALSFGVPGATSAGECATDGTGEYICSDSADSSNDVTQIFTDAETIVTEDGFGISTATGDAFDITISSDDFTFTDDNASTIEGAEGGISLTNDGDGDVTLTSTGTITGTDGSGVLVNNNYDGDVTISVADVSAYNAGIREYNDGDGDISITSTGTVTSANNTAIRVTNDGDGDLSIDVVEVTGNSDGINVDNDGAGAVSVSATGTVTGETDDGIYVYTTGEDLTITAVDVSGYEDGIEAYSEVGGEVTITSTGTVTGETGNGIYAYSEGGITISAVNSYGYNAGIRAINNTDGDVTVTSTGTVTSTINNGIRVDNYSDGDVTVSTVDVAGNNDGIHVNNDGIGSVTVTSTGTVTGETDEGIEVINTDGSVSITAANVYGYGDAISAISDSADVSVTVSGTVYSTTETAIDTDTSANTTITLESGADVSAANGIAIVNGDGDSLVTIEEGASVAGTITLGGGADYLSFDSTDFSDITLLDGGDDDDTVAFYGETSLSSTLLSNWEEVVIGDDGDVTFTDSELEIATLTINSGGILDVTEGFELTGDIANYGTLDAVDGDTADTITVTGDYSGTGEVALDVDSATNTADLLYIDGDVTSTETSYITVNDATSSSDAAADSIVVVEVTGAVDADDFALSDSVVGVYTYDLSFDQDSFLLSSEFNSNGGVYQNYTNTVLNFLEVGSLNSVRRNRTWLSSGDVVSRGTGSNVVPGQGGWVLVEGSTTDVSPTAAYTESYETNEFGITLGYDLQSIHTNNGDWTFGIVGEYGVSNTDLTFTNGTGTINSQKYLIGGTAWLEDQNRYFGAQAKVGFVSSDLASSTSGTILDNETSATVVVGLEAGQRFELAEGNTIIPQAELSYVYLDNGDVIDNDDNDVSFGSSESLTARIGLDYEFALNTGKVNASGNGSSAYLSGDLIHSFSSSNDITVGSTDLSSDTKGTWAEVGAGASFAFASGGDMFVEASYLFDVGSSTDDTESFNLKAGWKMKW